MKTFLFPLILSLLVTINTFSQQEVKNNKEEILLLWDASLSMKDRNIDKDFSFLNDFFKNKTAKVNLIIFNNQIIENVSFDVKSSDWKLLKDKLSTITYDGATDYTLLSLFVNKSNQVLFFTDGINTNSDVLKIFNSNGYVINSNSYGNNKKLKLLSVFNKAELINFYGNETVNTNKSNTKQSLTTYKGTVYKDSKPLENAKITIVDTDKSILTDKLGNFSIKAKKGTLVNVSYKEFTKKYILGNENPILINFVDKSEALNEVNITGVLDSEESEKKNTNSLWL